MSHLRHMTSGHPLRKMDTPAAAGSTALFRSSAGLSPKTPYFVGNRLPFYTTVVRTLIAFTQVYGLARAILYISFARKGMSQANPPNSSNNDPYSILGVPPTASDADIRHAYREASLQCHPDQRHGKNDHDRIQCHEQFTKLSSAYELLSNPVQRHLYDQTHRLDAAAMAHPSPYHALMDWIFREEFRDNVLGQVERRRTTRDVMNRRSLVDDCEALFHHGPSLFGSRSNNALAPPPSLEEVVREQEERMKRVQEEMEQPFGDLRRNGGYSTSASSSTRIVRNAEGELVRTTEQTVQRHGQAPQTVTETVITRPDGTIKERRVTGNEDLLNQSPFTSAAAESKKWWPSLWGKSQHDDDKRW